MNLPLVSISCTTFNHAKYIRKCLDGFLMQDYAGGVEILVHDDASTDGTSDIIREYAEKFPTKIFPVIQTENQYSKGVRAMMARFNFPRAKGKYIALCEGDDYWTDPQKLSKQVAALESNSDCVLCFHNIQVLMPEGDLRDDFITKVPETTLDVKTVARFGNFVHTPSVMFRNCIGVYDPLLLQSALGDFTMQMVLAEKGNFIQLSDQMAVYRYGVGEWSSEGEYKRRLGTAKTHLVIAEYYHQRSHPEVVDILLKRVNRFLREQQHKISSADLDYLLNGCAIKEEFLKNIWSSLEAKGARIEILKGKQLQSTPISGLVKEAFSRIKNRLLK